MKKLLLASAATALILSFGAAYAQEPTTEVAVDEVQLPVVVGDGVAVAVDDTLNGNTLTNTSNDNDTVLSNNSDDDTVLSNNDVNSNNDFMSNNTDNSTHDTDIASNNDYLSNNTTTTNTTLTDQSDDDLVDVDGGITVDTSDHSDDDVIDVDGGIKVDNSGNSDDDLLDNDGTITVDASDHSDDDMLDVDIGAIDASTNYDFRQDNSSDDDLEVTVGDVQVNVELLSQYVSGIGTTVNGGFLSTTYATTGNISNMTISATKGITQVSNNTGFATQNNNVSINAQVGSGE